MTLIKLGYGHTIMAERIVLILAADASRSLRRLKDEAYQQQRLINLTGGQRPQSVIVTDSNHVILCGVAPETII